jgi:hypothetical protein
MTATTPIQDIHLSLETQIYAALVSRSLGRSVLEKPQDQARIVAWDELVYRFLFESEYTEFPRGVLDLFADAPLYELWLDIKSEVEDLGSDSQASCEARAFAWAIYQILKPKFSESFDLDDFPAAFDAEDLESWETLLYETTLYLFPDLIYEPLNPGDIHDEEVAPFQDFLALGCTRLFITTSRVSMGLATNARKLSLVMQAKISIPDVVFDVQGLDQFRLLGHYLSGCLDGIQNYSMPSSLQDLYLVAYEQQSLALYESGWELVVFAQPLPTVKKLRTTPPVSGKPRRTSPRTEAPRIPNRRIVRLPIVPPTKEELAPPKSPRIRVGPIAAPAPHVRDRNRRTVDFTGFDPETRQRRPTRSFHRQVGKNRKDRIEVLLSYRELSEMTSTAQVDYLREWVRNSALGNRSSAAVRHFLWAWELDFVQNHFPVDNKYYTWGDVCCFPSQIADHLHCKLEKMLLFLSGMELRSQVVAIRRLYFHPPGQQDPVIYTPARLGYITPQYSSYLDKTRSGGSLFNSESTRREYVKLMQLLLHTSHEVWGFALPTSTDPLPVV